MLIPCDISNSDPHVQISTVFSSQVSQDGTYAWPSWEYEIMRLHGALDILVI